MKIDVKQIGAIKPIYIHDSVWECPDCGRYTMAMQTEGYSPPEHCGKPMRSLSISDLRMRYATRRNQTA